MAHRLQRVRDLTVGKCFSVLLCSVVLVVLTSACGEPPKKEISRVPSPDHIVDAVLVDIEPDVLGATVATPSLVYIVPAGSRQFDDPVLRGDYFEGLKLVWKRPKYLEIEFEKGRIFQFTNFWWSKEVQEFHYEVEVRLKPSSEQSLPYRPWPKD